jgi:hypothetical protein
VSEEVAAGAADEEAGSEGAVGLVSWDSATSAVMVSGDISDPESDD